MSPFHRALINLGLLALVTHTSASASQPVLHIEWPDGWEHREPQAKGSIVHLQARQRSGEQTLQQLSLIVVDARPAQAPISPSSIRELVDRLRDAALATTNEKSIPVHSMASGRGYYFVASPKRSSVQADFLQQVEGVLLLKNYVIIFTLTTNDATDRDAVQMMAALDRLSITDP